MLIYMVQDPSRNSHAPALVLFPRVLISYFCVEVATPWRKLRRAGVRVKRGKSK